MVVKTRKSEHLELITGWPPLGKNNLNQGLPVGLVCMPAGHQLHEARHCIQTHPCTPSLLFSAFFLSFLLKTLSFPHFPKKKNPFPIGPCLMSIYLWCPPCERSYSGGECKHEGTWHGPWVESLTKLRSQIGQCWGRANVTVCTNDGSVSKSFSLLTHSVDEGSDIS